MKLITNEVDRRVTERVVALYTEGANRPAAELKETFANEEGYTYLRSKVTAQFLSTDPDHEDGLFT